MEIGLGHYLALAAAMFSIGLYGMMARKNLLLLFFSTEILLNSANIALVAVAHFLGDLGGQIFAFFILAVAASEVAIGLGLLVAYWRKSGSLDLDNLQSMSG